MTREEIQIEIDKLKGDDIRLLSDGYHTFKELYDFRMIYNAALFNEWAKQDEFYRSKFRRKGFSFGVNVKMPKNVHKSWKHYDGQDCFGGGWFIVSAMLPTGLISNHYRAECWDFFKVPEVPAALFEYDGHSSQDVLDRIKKYIKNH